MKSSVRASLCLVAIMGVPGVLCAQGGNGLADNIKSLHSVLDQLYSEMIPMCKDLIGVGRGIAGFGAMWYIAYRVWRHLANAEPIDFYPLFRPFALGLCLILFPAVIGVINGVMQPMVTGTSAMVQNSDAAIATLLKQKQDAVKTSDYWQMYVGATGAGDRDKWYQYTHPDAKPGDEGIFESIGNDVKFAFAKASYNFRNAIKEVLAEILQVLFAAASLCINTMRTFNLIILAILGPLVFGLSVFDGFQHTLKHWLARYINVFLWLPVANIFGAVIGKIQENMLKIDISQINQTGDTFFSRTDAGYLIFMIIGIFGYLTVPSIASHIMWVGGGDALTAKTTSAAGFVAGGAMAASGSMVKASSAAALSGAGRVIDGIGEVIMAPDNFMEGYKEKPTGKGFAAALGRGEAGSYIRNKLSGKKDEA